MNETVNHAANPVDTRSSPVPTRTIRSNCQNITDAAIVAVANNCANLSSLDVQASRNITDAAIVAVAHNCANLASLDVGYVM